MEKQFPVKDPLLLRRNESVQASSGEELFSPYKRMTDEIFGGRISKSQHHPLFSPENRWAGCSVDVYHLSKKQNSSIVLFIIGFCISSFWMVLIVPVTSWAENIKPLSAASVDIVKTSSTHNNKPQIWQTGIGGGFRSGTQVFGLSAGASTGILIFGGEERHHLALTSISYGVMMGDVKGVGTWYQGNWELRGELFGGIQFNSETCWLVGLSPHVRYHFATGTKFVPYIDIGTGVTLTEIRAPDLGGTFQFNIQAIMGVNYFILDYISLSIEGRYLHMSSAAITKPNNGVNTVGIFWGINIFF